MKIFDCFVFYDEFDLLELRLKELYDHVDYFVLVESDLSFTCRQKPYWFEQHKHKFAKWQNKIRHIKHKSSAHQIPWHNEWDQRNAIMSGITDAQPTDVIMISDADELVRSDSINKIRQYQTPTFYGFVMPEFDFKFNYMRDDCTPEIITMAAKNHWVQKFSPQMLRNQKSNITSLPYHIVWQKRPKTIPLEYIIEQDEVLIFDHGGWHFSHLGNNEWLLEKAKNTSHQEDITEEFLQQLDVEKSIQERKCWNRYWPYHYEIVDLDEYFPANCADYPQHCLPDSGYNARSRLP